MQVTEYIREKIHSGTNGHVCFIDLQKAFLFLIYINDHPQYCEKSNLTLFADDTPSYNIRRNATNDLSEDILQLRKWFAANKFTVNISKW